MNPLKFFERPEYFFQPRLALRKLFRRRQPGGSETVRLPWGAMLNVRPHETIGAGIFHYGIFDLAVCEVLHRLLDPGETAADIGANIGQMTSLLRHRAGRSGRVIAFEPHPEIFAELAANCAPLSGGEIGPVELHQIALSDAPGEAFLDVGPTWETNRGMSRLVGKHAESATQIRVPVSTLDALIGDASIGVAKMDVEGHEPAVLEGAAGMLSRRNIRDLVFEDFGTPPTPTMQRLIAAGFTIYRLRRTWSRVRLLSPENPGPESPDDLARDYLATLDPKRAAIRFSSGGWQVLRR
jgi:FkbM family methyltransferase